MLVVTSAWCCVEEGLSVSALPDVQAQPTTILVTQTHQKLDDNLRGQLRKLPHNTYSTYQCMYGTLSGGVWMGYCLGVCEWDTCLGVCEWDTCLWGVCMGHCLGVFEWDTCLGVFEWDTVLWCMNGTLVWGCVNGTLICGVCAWDTVWWQRRLVTYHVSL